MLCDLDGFAGEAAVYVCAVLVLCPLALVWMVGDGAASMGGRSRVLRCGIGPVGELVSLAVVLWCVLLLVLQVWDGGLVG